MSAKADIDSCETWPYERSRTQAYLRGNEAGMGKWRGKSAPKQAQATPNEGRRSMSAAAKKKLSALMKARWAVKQKAKGTGKP